MLKNTQESTSSSVSSYLPRGGTTTSRRRGEGRLSPRVSTALCIQTTSRPTQRGPWWCLMSSLLGQGKLLPLSMLPVILELELGELDDCFDGSGNQWEISRPRLVADVLQIDQALMNSYSSHVLAGRSLPLCLTGLYSLKSAVPTGSSLYSFPVARGFTRLSTVYLSFWDGMASMSIASTVPLQARPTQLRTTTSSTTLRLVQNGILTSPLTHIRSASTD